QRARDRERESLCGLQVDDQLELGRLLNRKISRVGALKNTADIPRSLTVYASNAGPVAHQTARVGELAQFVDRRNGRSRGQRRNQLPPIVKERIRTNDQRLCLQSR